MSNTIVGIPERKHDFLVNGMYFWLTDSDIMLFRFKNWPHEDGVSQIKVFETIDDDGSFLYVSYVKHPFDGDEDFYVADQYRGKHNKNENYKIYKARLEIIKQMEEALFG